MYQQQAKGRKRVYWVILSAFIVAFFISVYLYLLRSEQFFDRHGYVPGYFNAYPPRLLAQTDTSGVDSIYYASIDGITRYRKLRKRYAGDNTLNSDGFRSPDFLTRDQRPDGRLVVGLIGDSFTFGCSAEPLNNCFADRLRADSGFYVDNLGVEATDLHQYMLVAQWYVPSFRPNALYVILSKGDYDTRHIRQTTPNLPIYYVSNYGTAFPTFDLCGKIRFTSIQKSINYYKDHYTLLSRDDFFSKWMAKTNVGTSIWKKFFWNDPEAYCPSAPSTWWYLQKIDSVCSAYGVVWKPLVIRGRDDPYAKDSLQFREAYAEYMRDFKFLFPALQTEDFVLGADDHTNNSGHLKIERTLMGDLRRMFPDR